MFLEEWRAADRVGVSVAARRWAVASGAVPPADGPGGCWSARAVADVDREGVRAALVGCTAFAAAELLTAALGDPLPVGRPPATARMIGDLVQAGVLVWLGADRRTPDVHRDQVAMLTRRRDLPTLLDRHTRLGPDQAARRLGVRRTEVDHLVRLRMLRTVGTGEVDFGRARGGVVEVPLYAGRDVALMPLRWPEVDWPALRALGSGRRSPLAGWESADAGMTPAMVARAAGVGRGTVTAWRRRHPDFPTAAGGTAVSVPCFDRSAVVDWLLGHGKVRWPSGWTDDCGLGGASGVRVGAG
ncbi:MULTISPECIES: hypothetical protein [unclassified Streptomyces]|uniref:hypothetical protein n=1 Tax=unclassified Streptomyces TaxID=2593676 RepID=UPI003647CCD5